MIIDLEGRRNSQDLHHTGCAGLFTLFTTPGFRAICSVGYWIRERLQLQGEPGKIFTEINAFTIDLHR